jgi:hypothetical protein
MTAEDFARLLNGKRIGKGKWIARCVAHPDKHASLAISEGKRQPIIFRCMSHQCPQDAILKAAGLSWSDLLGERAMTPQVRERVALRERLEKLEHRFGWIIMAKAAEPQRRLYWLSAEAGIERDIWALKRKIAAS